MPPFSSWCWSPPCAPRTRPRLSCPPAPKSTSAGTASTPTAPPTPRRALGKMMQGDTGIFVTSSYASSRTASAPYLPWNSSSAATRPRSWQDARPTPPRPAKLLPVLGANGFVLAVEMRSVEPPDCADHAHPAQRRPQPEAGHRRHAPRGRHGPRQGRRKVKFGDNHRSTSSTNPPRSTWLVVAGKHAVIAVGTDTAGAGRSSGRDQPAPAAWLAEARCSSASPASTSSRPAPAPSWTWPRSSRSPARNKEVREAARRTRPDQRQEPRLLLRLRGNAERGLMEMGHARPAQGRADAAAGKPFTLADVPPLPPDVIELGDDQLRRGASSTTSPSTASSRWPPSSPRIEVEESQGDSAKAVNDALGIDLRKDLLELAGRQGGVLHLAVGRAAVARPGRDGQGQGRGQAAEGRRGAGEGPVARLTGAEVTLKKRRITASRCARSTSSSRASSSCRRT